MKVTIDGANHNAQALAISNQALPPEAIAAGQSPPGADERPWTDDALYCVVSSLTYNVQVQHWGVGISTPCIVRFWCRQKQRGRAACG
jgi:hypothetical protein